MLFVAVSGLSDTHLLNHSYKLFRLAWRLFIGSECQIWQKVPSGGACQDLVKPWQVNGNVAWGWPVGGEMDLRINQPSLNWAFHLHKYIYIFYQLIQQWMHSVLYILHRSLLGFLNVCSVERFCEVKKLKQFHHVGLCAVLLVCTLVQFVNWNILPSSLESLAQGIS